MKKQNKVLVLFTTKKAYYFDRVDIKNVLISGLFDEKLGSNSFWLKVFRKLNSPLTKLFYEKWFKEIDSYDKIIVMDTILQYDANLLKNISEKSRNCQKFIYSWNIVKDPVKYAQIRESADKYGFKFYCYDLGNCKKYNMNFNTIMYDRKLKLPSVNIEYDALLLGFLKDRKDKMLQLYNAMIDAELNPRFVVVTDEENNHLPFEIRKDYIDYYQYLEMLNKSRAILDIAQCGQDGYSMRVMEAIFLNKKLITTNRAVKDANFYNSNNILVIELGKTSKEEIRTFFNKKFHKYSEEIISYYSFDTWINRFV
ncbi:MAG: hypothetical protein PHD56_11490 [Anaerostipes sp.]|nr:hypothetical protein [Anaerostipes sp.]